MRTAEWQLSQTKLLAPVGGIVNNLLVHEGDTAVLGTIAIGILDSPTWRMCRQLPSGRRSQCQKGEDRLGMAGHSAMALPPGTGVPHNPCHRPRVGEGMLLPYVAPTTNWIRLERSFPVTVTLVDPPAALPLMGADARIVISSQGLPR